MNEQNNNKQTKCEPEKKYINKYICVNEATSVHKFKANEKETRASNSVELKEENDAQTTATATTTAML